MERFFKTFSLRRRKELLPESMKPQLWQEDERRVRNGTCCFQVKYLGCTEVAESRGIQVCEQAIQILKANKELLDQQIPFYDPQRALLYVSGDALRVVNLSNRGLIVDQVIEKVSFCAPDRTNERAFAYICRDGTARRWMCHGFVAVKDSGERLSHAVGCAFTVCLERKQRRDKEKLVAELSASGSASSLTGSNFRQTPLAERMTDPQAAIVADPIPAKVVHNPYEVRRPHAPAEVLEQQDSFRSLMKSGEVSPFKRHAPPRVHVSATSTAVISQQNGDLPAIQSLPQVWNGPVNTTAVSTVMMNSSVMPTVFPHCPCGIQLSDCGFETVSDGERWLSDVTTSVNSCHTVVVMEPRLEQTFVRSPCSAFTSCSKAFSVDGTKQMKSGGYLDAIATPPAQRMSLISLKCVDTVQSSSKSPDPFDVVWAAAGHTASSGSKSKVDVHKTFKVTM